VLQVFAPKTKVGGLSADGINISGLIAEDVLGLSGYMRALCCQPPQASVTSILRRRWLKLYQPFVTQDNKGS
jgi:hypothetical protein